jgi:two-component system phosphate regulon sensor histidine kinase PhoR
VRPGARVDLGETAARVIDGLKLMASSEGVTLALARPEAPVVIRGDGDEIARLMENLIENAIKYGGTGKRVAVTVAAEGGDAMFGVRDFGPGIAPEHLPRLTERFYRVDAGASRAKGGTGLGLALVKHIASRHGGRLTIQSTLGAGAEFSVHFDRAK